MAAFYDWSPSSRGRGLKCHSDFEKNQITLVALFTRAWIEISFAVATADVTIVALFTRAWIEIIHICEQLALKMSPSSRGRGLKFIMLINIIHVMLSPSSRGRGLKSLCPCCRSCCSVVALFTRAWIEIIHFDSRISSRFVALFTRAWIEISRHIRFSFLTFVALFTRAWIEIRVAHHYPDRISCRPLHEGVV